MTTAWRRDECVAYEYARVRRFYAEMGIPQKTAMEWWNGPMPSKGSGPSSFCAVTCIGLVRAHKEA